MACTLKQLRPPARNLDSLTKFNDWTQGEYFIADVPSLIVQHLSFLEIFLNT